MLTVQACQQHRLAVMPPNKAKSFPAANVPAVAKLRDRRRGNVEPETTRGGMLGRHTRVSKSIDEGEVEAWWECRTQRVGRTKEKTCVENTWTWNRAKGVGHFLGKSDGRSGQSGRPSACNTRPPEEVSAGGARVGHVQRSHSSGQRR